MSDRSCSRLRRVSGLPQLAIRLALCGVLALMAGCAAISPRNVLPQAEANQTEIEGFGNIRFWGDGSAAVAAVPAPPLASGAPAAGADVAEAVAAGAALAAAAGAGAAVGPS